MVPWLIVVSKNFPARGPQVWVAGLECGLRAALFAGPSLNTQHLLNHCFHKKPIANLLIVCKGVEVSIVNEASSLSTIVLIEKIK